MIPLGSNAPPVSRDELIDALARGLDRLFEMPGGRAAVAARGESFPDLEHLSFDVTGARVRQDYRPRFPGGRRHSGVTASALHVLGRRVTVERAAVDFELNASGVHFDINHDQAQHYLDPVEAEKGHFQSHIGRADLEHLLLIAGNEEVTKLGLTIDRVNVTLRDQSPRSVETEVRVTASTKMAFATLQAEIRGIGKLVIDDTLNLRISGLHFEGEGLAGKMAAQLAHRQLHDFEGWSFPLGTLSLGRLRIHDVRLGCRQGLQVEATLGS